jgi:hypothetical protein
MTTQTVPQGSPSPSETLQARELPGSRLEALRGLHGVWEEFPEADGGTIMRFVLHDADDVAGN